MRGIWVLLLAALVGAGVYIGLFQQEWLKGLFRKAKGYSAAKTHSEALDKFTKAVKERDYDSAATYCGGDFGEQMRKGASEAKELAEVIDKVQALMKDHGVNSDNATYLLLQLQPFPRDIKFEKVEYKEGEEKATAYLTEESGAKIRPNLRGENLKLDPLMFRSLAYGYRAPIKVTIKREGDDKKWMIYFPKNEKLREAVNHFKEKYKAYVTGLEKLRKEVINDRDTKSNFERRLKTILEESK
jgi:hypothetical protein